MSDYPTYISDYRTCSWDYPTYILDYWTCRWDYPTYILDYWTYTCDYPIYMSDYHTYILHYQTYSVYYPTYNVIILHPHRIITYTHPICIIKSRGLSYIHSLQMPRVPSAFDVKFDWSWWPLPAPCHGQNSHQSDLNFPSQLLGAPGRLADLCVIIPCMYGIICTLIWG